MKLLYCNECHDIFALYIQERKCLCGKSAGQYQDRATAVYSGPCTPLGFANHAFLMAVASQPKWGQGKEFTAFVIPSDCPSFKRQA